MDNITFMSKDQRLPGCGEDSLYWIEKWMDGPTSLVWASKNWTWPLWIALAYIVVIFSLKHYMKTREAFDLRLPLALWDACLAVFSFLGVVRTHRTVTQGVFHYGLENTACESAMKCATMPVWVYLFMMSKVLELVDTLFIVLRKKNLIFLHWYHHAATLIGTWWSAYPFAAAGRWFMVMNFSAHTLMYSYYALGALRFKFPKWYSMILTSVQIAQMIIGVALCLISLKVKLRGDVCEFPNPMLYLDTVIYVSYLFLFVRFFIGAYCTKKTSPNKEK